MKINAYAKINLMLRVLGRRPDGFHELETLMQAVSLHDDVNVQWFPGGDGFEIQLSMTDENGGKSPLPCDERNLAFKAAKLARERLKSSFNGILKIDIVKRIPVAAGLAGGSADGAAVLTALTDLWEIPEDELYPLASALGSDVPFSFAAQNGIPAAIGRGRGTELEATEPVRSVIVLYNPGFGVSTPAVYAAWDDLAGKGMLPQVAGAEKYFNDLQIPALSLEPRIRDGFDKLWSAEPNPLHVQLSGSGPTVFAIYPENTDVKKLKKCLQQTASRAIIVEPLRKIHL